MTSSLIKTCCLLALATPALATETSYGVESPDGRLKATFHLRDGAPVYRLERDGVAVLGDSRLGMKLGDGVDLASGFEVASTERSERDETWEQPWGEQRLIHDHANELVIDLRQSDGAGGRRMRLRFRAYDDGVAFRYELPEQAGLEEFVILDELTEFAAAGDWSSWWVPGMDRNRYEYIYSNTPLSEVETVHTPITCQADERTFVAIHEAALVDYSSMTLQRTEGHTLEARLVPWSDGVKVRAAAPCLTPWRTIQVADSPSALLESTLILNLNEPNQLPDADWIGTGKYVGVLWEMHIGKATWGSGDKHGATTENTKRYIDFAAEEGFDGVLVEGWNVGWDGEWMENGREFSFTEPYPDYDLEGLAAYARERGVTLIGHHETAGAIPNYERQLEDAFALFERLGVRAVKTGYVDFYDGVERIDADGNEQGEWHHGQYMVRHHQKVVETAARHGVMVFAHEPIKDTGLRRTWPNLMSREGARGQEYNAWSGEGRNPPSHVTVLPYTRMLSGPMDYTPGAFDLMMDLGERPDDQIPGTLAKELALYVVVYSPWQMACDLPEAYREHPDALRFIQDVPVDWEETRGLAGVIGDYSVVARRERGGDVWCLGAVGDEEAREVEVDLAFLDPERGYIAEVYRDADDAHWRTNPAAYEIERREVTSTDRLTLKLAPGGGQAIRFVPR